MNKTLNFSWAHIFLFVALIVIAYFNYLGASFATGGRGYDAIWTVAITTLLLFSSFFMLQQLKAADHKFERCVIWERILFVVSLTMLYICIQPAWHFASVLEHKDLLTSAHESTLKHTSDMFVKYEMYAQERLLSIDSIMDEKLKNSDYYAKDLIAAGFSRDIPIDIHKQSLRETLRLQLLSDNYLAVKQSFLDWSNGDAKDINVWNIQQVDNISRVEQYINTYWYEPIKSMTVSHIKGIERDPANDQFDQWKTIISGLKRDSDVTRKMCVKYDWWSEPNLWSILWTIIALFAMLLAWLMQDRNTKSWVTFFGEKRDNYATISSNSTTEPTPKNDIQDELSGYSKKSHLDDTSDNSNDEPYGGGIIY